MRSRHVLPGAGALRTFYFELEQSKNSTAPHPCFLALVCRCQGSYITPPPPSANFVSELKTGTDIDVKRMIPYLASVWHSHAKVLQKKRNGILVTSHTFLCSRMNVVLLFGNTSVCISSCHTLINMAFFYSQTKLQDVCFKRRIWASKLDLLRPGLDQTCGQT